MFLRREGIYKNERVEKVDPVTNEKKEELNWPVALGLAVGALFVYLLLFKPTSWLIGKLSFRFRR